MPPASASTESTPGLQPKALAETIHESFSKPLPNINKKLGLGEKVNSSNTETLNTTPPMLWLDRSIADYTTPAETALAKRQVQEVTVQYCIPALEGTLRIECEPDVVRPSALYLLHPVHMALRALHPDVAILCMSEPYKEQTGKIRPDIVYKKNGKVFAILEYKVPGAVDKLEFDRARMPWASSKIKIADQKSKGSGRKDSTWFQDKSTVLMKQVTRYVNMTETTRYAALFNWDFMFLTVYDRLDTELIYGTLLSRTGSNTANKLRKAYLGWLMEA
ncbi:hypothetical protein C8A00DRAFT_15255, partial [Chaetomidium leptoderma]